VQVDLIAAAGKQVKTVAESLFDDMVLIGFTDGSFSLIGAHAEEDDNGAEGFLNCRTAFCCWQPLLHAGKFSPSELKEVFEEDLVDEWLEEISRVEKQKAEYEEGLERQKYERLKAKFEKP